MKSHLDELLEEAYYFGLTPKEAKELTFAEMASFIGAAKRRQLDDWRMASQIGYSAGIIASMSLQKTRPRFDEVFNFPKDSVTRGSSEIDAHKARMIVWAEQVNREYRKGVKGEHNDRR